MNILQNGIPKSGNGWVYNILHQCLIEGDVTINNYISNQPIFQLAQSWPDPLPDQSTIDTIHFKGNKIDYGIGRIFRFPITDWESYLEQATHIWNHDQYRLRMREHLKDISHLIYIIRDPRDASISHSHFIFTDHIKWINLNITEDAHTFMKRRFFYMVRRWSEHVGSWLTAAQHPDLNIHFVFYERLLHDFDNELDRLITFLGLDISAEARARVKAETTFESMKRKYPNHLRRGTSLEWVETLTKLQKKESVAMISKMLTLLNYPLAAPEKGQHPTPYIPANISQADIAEALLDTSRLTWREMAARVKRTGLILANW